MLTYPLVATCLRTNNHQSRGDMEAYCEPCKAVRSDECPIYHLPITGEMIAHVSDVLESDHGCTDYDATADYAANLIRAYDSLAIIASKYAARTANLAWLQAMVAYAVADNSATGGF